MVEDIPLTTNLLDMRTSTCQDQGKKATTRDQDKRGLKMIAFYRCTGKRTLASSTMKRADDALVSLLQSPRTCSPKCRCLPMVSPVSASLSAISDLRSSPWSASHHQIQRRLRPTLTEPYRFFCTITGLLCSLTRNHNTTSECLTKLASFVSFKSPSLQFLDISRSERLFWPPSVPSSPPRSPFCWCWVHQTKTSN